MFGAWIVAATALGVWSGAGKTDSADFARAYAPMLWFAVDEPVYPTLPHPFAFDGVAIETGPRSHPCDLVPAAGRRADFDNPTELTLDERCDRVALKRRFRPLLQGAPQGADDGPGPRPRMRVLYRGPEFFSGAIDITRFAGICASGAERQGALLEDLRKHLGEDHFLPVPKSTALGWVPVFHSDDRPEAKVTSASGEPIVLCRGEMRYRDERFASGKRAPEVRVRIRPAWQDTCRERLVADLPPDKACRGAAHLVAFAGPGALEAETAINLRLDVLLPPRYLIQYWFYFLYDRGVGGHRHDGEHAFVFVEGASDRPPKTTDPVVAIVGGGHEEDTANSILTAGSIAASSAIVDKVVFPERLPQHPMMLVELGKHASAPDRNLNGRFDIGLDANLWPENAWGSRDTQTALLGKAQIGKMNPWYSLPRSEDSVFTEEAAWEKDPGDAYRLAPEYHTGYPSALFREFESRVAPGVALRPGAPRLGECDFGGYRTFRLMPISALRDLQGTITGGWTAVRSYLLEHQASFWEPGCFSGLPEDDPSGLRIQQLGYWLDTENEKRDVWVHRKFLDPDSVFKTHLFPRIAFGASFASLLRSDRSYGFAAQFADLGRARNLHDSTLELAVYHRPNVDTGFARRSFALTVENFRGRHRGWYLGGSTDADRATHRRWYFRAGYVLQLSSLERFSSFKPLHRTKLNLRFGGRGLVWGGSPIADGAPDTVEGRVAFELTLNITFGAWVAKHPLKFASDIGQRQEKERE